MQLISGLYVSSYWRIPFFLDISALKMRTVFYLKTSESHYPLTQHHIAEDRNHRVICFEKPLNREFGIYCQKKCLWLLNPLTPNGHYSGRTAPLTSKRCTLCIYSTHIGTEYFKHGIYSPYFTLQNAVCFIILTYLVPVLFTFYIQVC